MISGKISESRLPFKIFSTLIPEITVLTLALVQLSSKGGTIVYLVILLLVPISFCKEHEPRFCLQY